MSEWDWSLVKMVQHHHRQYVLQKERRQRRNNCIDTAITLLDKLGWWVVLFTMCYIEWQVLSIIFN